MTSTKFFSLLASAVIAFGFGSALWKFQERRQMSAELVQWELEDQRRAFMDEMERKHRP